MVTAGWRFLVVDGSGVLHWVHAGGSGTAFAWPAGGSAALPAQPAAPGPGVVQAPGGSGPAVLQADCRTGAVTGGTLQGQQILDGTTVTVLDDRRDDCPGWVQVAMSDGARGWLPLRYVGVTPVSLPDIVTTLTWGELITVMDDAGVSCANAALSPDQLANAPNIRVNWNTQNRPWLADLFACMRPELVAALGAETILADLSSTYHLDTTGIEGCVRQYMTELVDVDRHLVFNPADASEAGRQLAREILAGCAGDALLSIVSSRLLSFQELRLTDPNLQCLREAPGVRRAVFTPVGLATDEDDLVVLGGLVDCAPDIMINWLALAILGTEPPPTDSVLSCIRDGGALALFRLALDPAATDDALGDLAVVVQGCAPR